jgi:hypothetical protein
VFANGTLGSWSCENDEADVRKPRGLIYWSLARNRAVSGIMVTAETTPASTTYVRIAAISGPGPMMFMTRVRLQASYERGVGAAGSALS